MQQTSDWSKSLEEDVAKQRFTSKSLNSFGNRRSGNARDLDKFVDLLDIAIINLKDADQTQELGDGSIYTKIAGEATRAHVSRVSSVDLREL